MRVIDLSEGIRTGMNIYPGDPEVVIERTPSIETDGWEIDDIPRDRFFGPTRRVSSSDNLQSGIGLLMDFSPCETDIDTIIQACPLFVGCNQL